MITRKVKQLSHFQFSAEFGVALHSPAYFLTGNSFLKLSNPLFQPALYKGAGWPSSASSLPYSTYLLSCLLSTYQMNRRTTKQQNRAPSEDADQPDHLPSQISLCYLHEETVGP